MTNRRDEAFSLTTSLRGLSLAATALAAGLALSGCEKKQQPQQQAAPAPAPAPKPVVSLDGVKLHPKVQFPDSALPSSQDAVEAIAALMSALASGDAAAMQRLLSERDQTVLKSLVESGEWQRQAEDTQAVRVATVREEGGAMRVGLALEDALGAFLTGWEATRSGDAWVFAGIAVESKIGTSVEDLDGAELTPLELPKGTALSNVDLRAAEPPPRVVRDEKNKSSGGSSGGGFKPPRRNR